MAGDFFCLDLGNNYVRVADANVSEQTVDISSLGSIACPLNIFLNPNEKSIDEAAKSVEKLVNDLKITKKNVNIILPDTYSYSQILPMPYLKEKELFSAIKYQADQFIPLPLDEAALDLNIISEDKTKKNLLILIVAASQKLIDIVVRVVEKVGLIPQNIENEVSAAGKLLTTIYKNKTNKQPLIIVNLGYYSTSLYYYDPQLNLIHDIHNFKVGLDLFSREVQVNFNLDKQKTNEALKTIGLGKNGSLNMEEILKPVFNDFVAEIEKFILAIKEKEKIPAVEQILTFNLSNQINLFDKGLENRLGIKTGQLSLEPMVKKNANANVFMQQPGAFISVIGGNIS